MLILHGEDGMVVKSLGVRTSAFCAVRVGRGRWSDGARPCVLCCMRCGRWWWVGMDGCRLHRPALGPNKLEAHALALLAVIS
jgi:hypothetical protein